MTDKTLPSNNDEVICPSCTHEFRAIPINVQAELNSLRTTIFTDNTQTVMNAEREIERLTGELEIKSAWLKEAAASEEKLKAELSHIYKQSTQDMDDASDAMEFAEKERDQLRQEVERLTKEVVDRNQRALDGDKIVHRVNELCDEVERLTHELDLAVRLGKSLEEQRNELNAQLITTIGQQIEQEPVDYWRKKYADLGLRYDQLVQQVSELQGALREADKHCPVNSTAEILVRAALASGAAPKEPT